MADDKAGNFTIASTSIYLDKTAPNPFGPTAATSTAILTVLVVPAGGRVKKLTVGVDVMTQPRCSVVVPAVDCTTSLN